MVGGSPNGWIVLDKPVGLGSTQAVAAVKRNLRAAGIFERFGKVKVGHGGTLDPLASGVLPIALGEATKLAGRMLDSDKTYAFTVAFGSETDTLDREGAVIATSALRPTLAGVEAVLARLTGAIEQVPPAYSALKVGGARAYDLARAGEAVELAGRAVTIHALAVRHAEPGSGSIPQQGKAPQNEEWTLQQVQGDDPVQAATFEAHVSKGTYIRSLARDLARALGTVGHVTMLRRLRAGPFALDRAISLDSLNAIGQGAALENILLPLEAGLDGIPALDLSPEQARAVRQGRVLAGLAFQDGVYWGRSGMVPVALVELAGGSLTVLRGFNLSDAAE